MRQVVRRHRVGHQLRVAGLLGRGHLAQVLEVFVLVLDLVRELVREDRLRRHVGVSDLGERLEEAVTHHDLVHEALAARRHGVERPEPVVATVHRRRRGERLGDHLRVRLRHRGREAEQDVRPVHALRVEEHRAVHRHHLDVRRWDVPEPLDVLLDLRDRLGEVAVVAVVLRRLRRLEVDRLVRREQIGVARVHVEQSLPLRRVGERVGQVGVQHRDDRRRLVRADVVVGVDRTSGHLAERLAQRQQRGRQRRQRAARRTQGRESAASGGAAGERRCAGRELGRRRQLGTADDDERGGQERP